MKLSFFKNSKASRVGVSPDELKSALQQNELALYFMPVVNIKEEKTVELEALLRWPQKDDRFIPPMEFISVAEQNGFMPELTRWVVKQVIQLMSAWRKHGCSIQWTINLSNIDLVDQSLIKEISTELKSQAISPGQFGLEISHYIVQQNDKQILDCIGNIHSAGIRLVLDNYDVTTDIKTVPLVDLWDSIKINRNVVMGRQSTSENLECVKRLVRENQTALICAPGAHTFREWKKIKSLGCDQAQGYYISPAQAADEMELWLRMSSWGDHSADQLHVPNTATGVHP